MAIFAFTDGTVIINSVNYSAYVKSVELNVEVDDLETTAMGATHKSRIGGLKEGSLSITFNQDFAQTTVDDRLWALLGTVTTFEVRPTSGAASTSNPKYTGSVLITEWNPLGNSVGELAEVSVTWPTSGTVTRATA